MEAAMEATAVPCRVLAGIDVHKKMLAVVIRRDHNGETSYQKRAFGTTRSEIEHLTAWLQHNHVSEVVMESTAQYWRPVWYGMEAHFTLHLSHPLQTRAPRGRKRDSGMRNGWRTGSAPATLRRASFREPNREPGAGWRAREWICSARSPGCAIRWKGFLRKAASNWRQ
jgi:hypothetical protein